MGESLHIEIYSTSPARMSTGERQALTSPEYLIDKLWVSDSLGMGQHEHHFVALCYTKRPASAFWPSWVALPRWVSTHRWRPLCQRPRSFRPCGPSIAEVLKRRAGVNFESLQCPFEFLSGNQISKLAIDMSRLCIYIYMCVCVFIYLFITYLFICLFINSFIFSFICLVI